MNQRPMKLGILALLLLIISICITVLAVLSFSTAQADLRLSQRYAETTTLQYQREAEGQAFLQQASRTLSAGGALTDLEGVVQTGEIYEKTVTRGNAALHIGLRLTGQNGFEIVRWETNTQWTPDETIGSLWEG